MKTIWGFIILLLTLNICQISSAEEQIWYQVQSQGGMKIYVLFSEEGLWIVDEYMVFPGELQERVGKKTYKTYSSAEKYLNSQNGLFQGLFLMMNVNQHFSQVQSAQNFIWKATHTWSWEWEEKYAQWLQQTATSGFLAEHQIATDCADVVYTYRWIFARIHGLPMGHQLPGTGVLFTHETVKKEWLKLPTNDVWHKDQRFLAALRYVQDYTYTHSLLKDSYPVSLEEPFFRAGIYHLILDTQSGHTQLVFEVNREDSQKIPIRVLESTVPQEVRVLIDSGFWNDVRPKSLKQGGFLAFRWLEKVKGQWHLRATTEMPGYSLKQYAADLIPEGESYGLSIMKLMNPNFNPLLQVKDIIHRLKEGFKQRKEIVEQGFQVCQTQNCQEGTALYESWSTPSRDKRLGELFQQALRTADEVYRFAEGVEDYLNQNQEIENFEIMNEPVTLKMLLFSWKLELFSSLPWDSVERRWGLEPNAFYEKINHDYQVLIQERIQRTSSLSCQNVTESQEDQWKNCEINSLDKKLVNLNIQKNLYCMQMPPSFCEQLNYLMTKEYRILNKKQSLLGWFNESLWFLSDPHLSNSLRWAQQLESGRVYDLGFVSRVLLSDEDFLFFALDKGGIFKNLKTNQEIYLEPSIKYESVLFKNSRLLGVRDQEIFVFDPHQRTQMNLKLDEVVKNAKWLNENVILAHGHSHAFLIQYVQNEFGEVLELERVHEIDNQKQNQNIDRVFAKKDQNNHLLVNLIEGTFEIFPLSFLIDGEVFNIRLKGENERYLLLLVNYQLQEEYYENYYVFDKETSSLKEIKNWNDFETVLAYQDPWLIVSKDNEETIVYRSTQDFQNRMINQKISYNMFSFSFDEDYSLAFSVNDNKDTIFSFHHEKGYLTKNYYGSETISSVKDQFAILRFYDDEEISRETLFHISKQKKTFEKVEKIDFIMSNPQYLRVSNKDDNYIYYVNQLEVPLIQGFFAKDSLPEITLGEKEWAGEYLLSGILDYSYVDENNRGLAIPWMDRVYWIHPDFHW